MAPNVLQCQSKFTVTPQKLDSKKNIKKKVGIYLCNRNFIISLCQIMDDMIQEQETKYYEGNPSCGVEPSESVYYLYETPVERFFRVMFNKFNS